MSCVKGYNDIILAGSYDHTVQLWDLSGELLIIIPGHNGAVKAVNWINTGEFFFFFSHFWKRR